MRILDAVKTYDVSNVGYAKVCNADLLLATDPDCDRVGIAVKNKAVEYELLTGNQTGISLSLFLTLWAQIPMSSMHSPTV